MTIVIIKVPEIFNDSVSALEDFGYNYILSKTESPLSSDYKVIEGSKQELYEPVSYNFELGGCTWQLDVTPVNGWKNDNKIIFVIIGCFIIIVLLEVLIFAFLNMQKQREKRPQRQLPLPPHPAIRSPAREIRKSMRSF